MFYNLQTTWQFIFLFLGLLIFAFLVWRRPKIGAGLVIFCAPFYLLKINYWPMTLLEAMIWVLAIVWLAGQFKKEKKREVKGSFNKYNKNFWLALGLVLVGAALSSFFSMERWISFGIFKAWFLAPIIFAFIASNLFKEGEDLKIIFFAFFASSVTVAIISLVYLALGRLTFDGRLSAFYFSPNYLAMWLAPGLLAGFGLWPEAKNYRSKFLLSIFYCLLFIILYFTYSYGAWLALGAAAVFTLFYLWHLKRITRRQLLIVSCLLLIFIVSSLFLQFSSGQAEKLINLLFSPRSSWQSRLIIWQSGIKILKDHWFLGIGPGLFQQYYLDYQKFFPPYLEWAVPQPHNLFLAWWLQTGMLGLTGFLWLVVQFFRQKVASLAKTKASFVPLGGTKEGESLPAIILMAVMISFLVHGLVDTTFWKNDLALVFWVIIFLGCRAGRRVGL